MSNMAHRPLMESAKRHYGQYRVSTCAMEARRLQEPQIWILSSVYYVLMFCCAGTRTCPLIEERPLGVRSESQEGYEVSRK
jgi:hypothetical protein